MSIVASELKLYAATVANDTTSNGGAISGTEIVSGVKNNIWPDVSQAERTAGSVKYRKVFIKVDNAGSLALTTARIFIETPTPGDDSIVIMSGTPTDTQAEADDYTRFYGAGALDADLVVGASTLAVNVEPGNAAVGANIFQDGDLIRVSDKATVDASSGNTEFVHLASSNAVSWSGNKATLTLASGVTLANAYTASDTRVASVLEVTSIADAQAVWQRRTVPAGASSISGDKVIMAISGESA
ncbi:MAG: hypothetical protein HQM04_18760 [Magnetococcales bacterium]|nr:hypothetical protein [Magnetococcales bacterium]MBF0117072.1 hypothetical protein [Magnetococcales bacterium]